MTKTAKEAIQQAERVTVAHLYGDGTALYDLLVDEKAYSVRVYIEDFAKLRETALYGKETN